MTDEITDSRAYRQLLSACEGWSIGKQDVLELLDAGRGWPATLPKLPGWIFERCADESSVVFHVSDIVRRARRQRAARMVVSVVMEQARCDDLTAAAETLARMLARGNTRSQSRLETSVRPDGRLRRPDARQAG